MRLRFAVLIGLLLGHSFGLLLAPHLALATSGSVYFSELQTGGSGTGHANDEFIELYNATASDISMKGWKIEYRAVSAANGDDCTKGWSKSVALPDKAIKSHRYFLLADKNYPLVADATFSLDLSSTAGTIHILDADKKVVDALAWGDGAACGMGRSAALAAGQSLERLPGAQVPTGGNGYDTGDNANDFLVRPAAEPQSSTAPAETPLQFASPDPGATAQIELSEAFINPGPDAATGPYLEFHNTSDSAVVLNSYSIKLGLTGYYLPQRVLLPDAYAIVQSDAFPLNLDPQGGSASLFNASGTMVDELSWPAAPVGASRVYADGGWTWTAKPTPGAANELVDLPAPVPPALAPSAPASDSSAGPDAPVSYPALEITELLPDPAAPATDADDEYIELHNPNPSAVDVGGYVIKTGNTLSDSYTLPSATLGPGQYAVFTSADTHLALANNGGAAALYDPSGHQFGNTITYGAAKTGQAWAKFDTGWSWTTTPTPGEPNVLTQSAALPATTAAAKAAKTPAKSTKPGSVKAATTKKASAKTAAKPKAAKPKSSSKASQKAAHALVAAAATPAGHWLLFVLAGLTIAYIIYEFRYDLRNLYFQLRGYPGRGRTSEPPAEGRGSDRASQRSGRRQDHLRPGASPRTRLQW